MDNPELRISAYIDALNEEKEPTENLEIASPGLEEIFQTIRLLPTCREPAMPDPGYPQRLVKAVMRRLNKAGQSGCRSAKTGADRATKGSRRRVWAPAAALAACLLMGVLLANQAGFFKRDLVYAMEKALARLADYHGVLEVRSENEAGEIWINRTLEIWSDGERYAVRQEDGTLTVNNGERKWQLSPQEKTVTVLPLLPDRMEFDLRGEAARARQYPYAAAGEETVAGRKATKLEIAPPGGLPYCLWIDAETNLPVQLQTAMHKALQTTYTFVSFVPNAAVDPGLFAYEVPAGYTVVENDPGVLVATVEEAAAISGFMPLLPREAPQRLLAFQDRIVLDYGDTSIVQSPARGTFKPEPNASLGSAAGGPLEVWWEQLRWQQEGLEIAVEGPRRVELTRQLTADLALPDRELELAAKAQVKVEVDLEIAAASQRQVDGGSSPWQLDPLQVALTFVNLMVTPEGISGEPQVPMAAFSQVANNGVEAVVAVDTGPVKHVYLKRLIRQDESGIWSVVGYDPR